MLDRAGVPHQEVRYETLAGFLDALFARLDGTRDSALHAAGVDVGGIDITLRSSNPDVLSRYLLRLAAGPAPGGRPARRIDVVAASEMGWPAGHWSQADWQMHVFDEIVTRAGYDVTYPYFERQWIAYQRRTGNAVYFLDRMEDLLPWDAGSPIRLPLHWMLLGKRRRMIHAGSLGLGGDGVLIVGRGGSGKSGTTLAGIAGGLKTVGDDYVLLDQADRPTALPLYRLLKQDPAGLARIPGLSERVGDRERNWQGKFELDPEALFPGCMAGSLRLRAILLPEVAHLPATRFERLDRAPATKILVEPMLEQLPVASTESVMFFAGLTAQLPVYRAQLSEDAAEIASSVRRLIEDHAERGRR